MDPMLIPIAGILMPIAIVYIVFSYENKKEQRFHDLVQKLVDSGQELNEEVLSSIPGYKKTMPRDDLRYGLFTFATGIGIALLGSVALGSVVFGAGLLVTCIGGAIFGYGYYTRNLSEQADR